MPYYLSVKYIKDRTMPTNIKQPPNIIITIPIDSNSDLPANIPTTANAPKNIIKFFILTYYFIKKPIK